MTKSELIDLYLRLSVDREGKDSLERQEADLRAWAERSGLTVRKVWKDAGLSGYKDVARADFDAAISAVSNGEVGTLAVWKLDRLSRKGAGQVGLVLDAVEKAGGRIFFLQDNLDSSVSGHRMVIVVVSEQARAESANTVLRVKAKIAADAAKGMPKKGTRAFGWEPDGITIRESEAVHVREAVRAYLAGERSLIQTAHLWNGLGILTDGMQRPRRGRGGEEARMPRQYWTATTVRNVLWRERNAGLLVHHGAVMPESRIEPIITPAELDELRSRAKVGTPVSERAQSFLGGILRCACGAPMHHSVAYSQRKGGPRNTYAVYTCSQKLYDRTQKHATVQAHIVDQRVSLDVLAALALGVVKEDESPAYAERYREIVHRLTLIDEQEARAEDALVEGLGDAKRLKGKLAALKAERAELHEELKRVEADRAGANVFRVIEKMREVIDAVAWGPDTPLSEIEEWALEEVSKAWDGVPVVDRQALIRARFRVSVRLGGRGAERVTTSPR